jgi:hypothetical protein
MTYTTLDHPSRLSLSRSAATEEEKEERAKQNKVDVADCPPSASSSSALSIGFGNVRSYGMTRKRRVRLEKDCFEVARMESWGAKERGKINPRRRG